ncbi:hypothetical protein HG537_0B04240 [Torulaspora globosa]|uniref:Capsid protein n=1 Tax=Torulaspora globosa TaxID=48254 RepID=A0A7H9HP88_9SACH|nr:hypothetical protein HG537_0B04240 [Torulaspora sp. CBS 2947]
MSIKDAGGGVDMSVNTTREPMDLTGIVEQLAAAVAFYSWTGHLDTSIICGSEPVNIEALGDVAPSTSQVFIPRIVDTVMTFDVFSVIAAAANAYGTTVMTDIFDNSNFEDVFDAHAAAACVDAINLIAGNYQVIGADSVVVYAVIRGVHRIVSVIGHTDEDGIMQDVLRCSGFNAPYGVIHSGTGNVVTLPRLVSLTQNAATNWVDSVALISAASVAHCDPCNVYNGSVYPTLITSGCNPEDCTPVLGPGTSDDSREITSKLYQDFARFAETWAGALGKIFGMSGSRTAPVVNHLINCSRLLAGQNIRHARYRSVAPFYWIEPTSLLPANAFGTTAEAEGFASLVTPGQEMTRPGFERIKKAGDMGSVIVYDVVMRSARTAALLTHLTRDSKDGLADMTVWEADPTYFANVGASPDAGRTLYDRMLAREGFDSWMWTRGQCPIPAPSEFLNLEGTMRVAVVHFVFNEDDLLYEYTHVPLPQLFENTTVTFNVSRPGGISPAKPNKWISRVARARTNGTVALEQARRNVDPALASEILDLPIKFTIPRGAFDLEGDS